MDLSEKKQINFDDAFSTTYSLNDIQIPVNQKSFIKENFLLNYKTHDVNFNKQILNRQTSFQMLHQHQMHNTKQKISRNNTQIIRPKKSQQNFINNLQKFYEQKQFNNILQWKSEKNHLESQKIQKELRMKQIQMQLMNEIVELQFKNKQKMLTIINLTKQKQQGQNKSNTKSTMIESKTTFQSNNDIKQE